MEEKKEKLTISAPNFEEGCFTVTGLVPYVQQRFALKPQRAIKKAQEEGASSGSKRNRAPKDFKLLFEQAQYRTEKGHNGIPCTAFRSAMIDSCKLVSYKMTMAKLAIFVEADGYDVEEGVPLVRIYGKPVQFEKPERNSNGNMDLRSRPMWKPGWTAKVRVRFDADVFKAKDIANLLARAGLQVGIGEGRPNSRRSNGCGWGLFSIEEEVNNGRSVS